MHIRKGNKKTSALAKHNTRHTGVGKFRIWGIAGAPPPKEEKTDQSGHMCTMVTGDTPLETTPLPKIRPEVPPTLEY